MIVIPLGKTNRIELTSGAAWQLSELKSIMGRASWTFVSNMRSLPQLMTRIAMRNIEATPDEISTAQQVADAWEKQVKRFTEIMERHAPAQKVLDELDDLRRENAELKAALRAATRPKKEKQ